MLPLQDKLPLLAPTFTSHIGFSSTDLMQTLTKGVDLDVAWRETIEALDLIEGEDYLVWTVDVNLGGVVHTEVDCMVNIDTAIKIAEFYTQLNTIRYLKQVKMSKVFAMLGCGEP